MAQIPAGKHPDPTAILDLLTMVPPSVIQRRSPGSCIITTRVAIEVLADYGIVASPLVVHGVIGNAAYARQIRGNDSQKDPGPGRRPCEEQKATWVRVGGGDLGPNCWPHHLVTVVEGRWVLDLSIDEASDAERGIEFSPFWAPCDGGFLTGREPLLHTGGSGCFLRYEAQTDERSYGETENWKNGPVVKMVERVRDWVRGDPAP